MLTYTKCIFIVAIIAVFANTAHAIACFSCRSDIDPNCRDMFNATVNITECRGYYAEATGCVKNIFKEGNKEPVISRSCFFGNMSDAQSYCYADGAVTWRTNYTWRYDDRYTCHACDKDLCNNSVVSRPITYGIVLLVTLTRLISL